MINYNYFKLDNGLKVFVHEDHSISTAVLNILYNVGSKDEDENKTGFAHLFEHLMFGGSKNIPSYDMPLELVGGENNAFTSPDITNYYITLPAVNIETAFWLESDRMLSLSFDPRVLEVQRSVVIEEFKQRYLNQPYGDVWLKLRPLTYQVHPYKRPTIGKEISHIENATMDDVKEFFYTHYLPNNAIMVVGGNVTLEQVKALSEKWFGPIPAGKVDKRNLPQEPKQTAARFEEVQADVPLDALYKVYHMEDKLADSYYATDLLSDLMGRGKSSRLYDILVKEKQLFNSIGSHVSGSMEPGLFIIEGKLNEGVSIEEGEKAVMEIVEDIRQNGVKENELQKVKNQAESSIAFGEVELLNRAMNLAYAALLGDPDLINKEADKIRAITIADVKSSAVRVLQDSNCSTLYYRKKAK